MRHPDTPDVPQPAVTLDYGRSRRPWRLRKRHLLVAVTLAGCAAGSWTVGREARQRTQNLLYVRQAARHVEPAETVVFEPDPARAAGLVRAGTHQPLTKSAVSPAGRVEPDSFRVLRQALAQSSFEAMGALVFLHELTTPSGARRIVAVHFLPYVLEGTEGGGGAGLVARIFETGGYFGPPVYVGDSNARMLVPADAPALVATSIPPAAAVPLRWFAGQPDADDPSHFTLDYELDGVHGTVDGYLTDDGGSVRMQARDAADRPATDALPVAEATYRLPKRG